LSNGNENNPITVTRETRITNRDIADLLVTAFEGGVNYWMDEAEPLGDFDFKKAPWYDDQMARHRQAPDRCRVFTICLPTQRTL